MKTRMALGKELVASFGALLAVTILLCGFAMVTFGDFQDSLKTQVTTSAQKADLIGQVTTSLAEMHGQQQLLISDASADANSTRERKEALESASAKLNSQLTALEPLMRGPQEKRMFQLIQNDNRAWTANHRDLTQRCADCHSAAVAGSSGRDTKRGQLDEAVTRLAQLQRASLASASTETSTRMTRSRWILMGHELLCLLVAFGILRVIRRSTKSMRKTAGMLSEGAKEAAVAASQVKHISAPLAQSTALQASAVATTSATAAELASMTQQNADNSSHSAELMRGVEQAVQSANLTLRSLQTSMDEIGASSDKISGIIKVIDGIAFQTNILALNAAVEAARAGDSGLGFAVVAQEVRSLAVRSAQAAHDTGALIEESVVRSSEARARLEEVIRSIQGVTVRSGEVKALVDGVSTASHEQAKGIEEIATAVHQMEHHVDDLSHHVEELVAAGDRMATQTTNMQNVSDRLYTLVDGSTTAHAR
jgi:methyl-accepting chemotaxis protein